jgi:lysophospholipase L1-like esterase
VQSSSAISRIAKRAVTVAMYGDSTVYSQTTIEGVEAQSIPTVEEMEQKEIGDPLISISNSGDPGTVSNDWIKGGAFGGYEKFPVPSTWDKTMKAEHAEIIDITIDINDAYTMHLPVTEHLQNLRKLIAGAQSAGKSVVLETGNPTTIQDPKGEALLADYANAELALCAILSIQCIDQYHHFLTQPDWEKLLSDAAHPTLEGYKVKASYAASQLKSRLTALELSPPP